METIWFFLWALLWTIYFMLDGYDLGIGSLLPFFSKNENERRVMINAMGPFWDGNEVWLVTAGGVTFAAFPKTYAVLFSTLYTPLMILLFALILRGISFEFRGKIDDRRWRRLWDGCLTLGSIVPGFLFGVTFGNLFQGIPIDESGILRGDFFTLLSPYALLSGVLFVFLFVVHGALWLAVMTDEEMHERSLSAARGAWPALVSVLVTFLVSSALTTDLYQNAINRPVLFLFPVLSVVALIATRTFIGMRKPVQAFASSAIVILGTGMFGFTGLYPNMLLSSLNPQFSLTAFNSASSALTLKIMLGITLVVIPIVIAYQSWVHVLFGKKIRLEELKEGESY